MGRREWHVSSLTSLLHLLPGFPVILQAQGAEWPPVASSCKGHLNIFTGSASLAHTVNSPFISFSPKSHMRVCFLLGPAHPHSAPLPIQCNAVPKVFIRHSVCVAYTLGILSAFQ